MRVQMYVALFLLWCVLSSKHILIYNEETLVALSFFLFVYLVYRYAGNALGDSLDSRGRDIAAGLNMHLRTRGEALHSLVAAHESVAHLGRDMAMVAQNLEHSLHAYVQHTGAQVRTTVGRGVSSRCAHLAQVSRGRESRMLMAMATALPTLVLVANPSHGVSTHSLEQALRALR